MAKFEVLRTDKGVDTVEADTDEVDPHTLLLTFQRHVKSKVARGTHAGEEEVEECVTVARYQSTGWTKYRRLGDDEIAKDALAKAVAAEPMQAPKEEAPKKWIPDGHRIQPHLGPAAPAPYVWKEPVPTFPLPPRPGEITCKHTDGSGTDMM